LKIAECPEAKRPTNPAFNSAWGYFYQNHPLSHFLMGCAFTGIPNIAIMLESRVLQKGMWHFAVLLSTQWKSGKVGHRSKASNRVTGRQSLSTRKKCFPGNEAPRAARIKVPAQVGWTLCKPVASDAGKSKVQYAPLWGQSSANGSPTAGQCGRPGSRVV